MLAYSDMYISGTSRNSWHFSRTRGLVDCVSKRGFCYNIMLSNFFIIVINKKLINLQKKKKFFTFVTIVWLMIY